MLTIIASHFIGQSFFSPSPPFNAHPHQHQVSSSPPCQSHFRVSESLFISIQLLWFHPRTDMAILPILSKRQLVYEGPRKSTLKTYILHPSLSSRSLFSGLPLHFPHFHSLHSIGHWAQLSLCLSSSQYTTIPSSGKVTSKSLPMYPSTSLSIMTAHYANLLRTYEVPFLSSIICIIVSDTIYHSRHRWLSQ